MRIATKHVHTSQHREELRLLIFFSNKIKHYHVAVASCVKYQITNIFFSLNIAGSAVCDLLENALGIFNFRLILKFVRIYLFLRILCHEVINEGQINELSLKN